MRKKLKVGLAQIRHTGSLKENLQKTIVFLEEGAKKKLDLVCFPEASLSGYCGVDIKSLSEINWKEVNASIEKVRSVAKKLRIAATIGTNRARGGKVANSALLISRAGRLIGEYSKTQLTERDLNYYQPGNSINLLRLEEMALGMMICFDQRFPEPWRALALRGAQVVFHLSNACEPDAVWKRPVVEAHVVSRAAENGYYVCSVNRAGPGQNWASMICNPDGLVIAKAQYDKEEIVWAELDLTVLFHKFLPQRRTDLVELVVKC